jgi:hypothetical protein
MLFGDVGERTDPVLFAAFDGTDDVTINTFSFFALRL